MSVAKMGLYWSLSTILLINSVAYAEESVFDTGWKPGKKDLYSQGNKIVVHMNLLPTDDQLRKMVRSFQHIHEADKKADIKVIVHGPALELFKTASLSEDNRKLINKARSLGVQFLICNNSLISSRIHISELYEVKPQDVVAAGILEIVKLQKKGYQYIRYF